MKYRTRIKYTPEQKSDEAHLKAMDEMKDLMKNPDAMKEWFENKRMEFDDLLED